MTRMSLTLRIIAAVATATAAAATLVACSTDTGSQSQSDQSSATAADSAASAADTPAASDSPPFPELGPFDPNLTGAEMPDPCLWATPEFMAELGLGKFLGSETFNSFRDCDYAPDVEHNSTGYTVGVQFSRTPLASQGVSTEQEFNGITIYSSHDGMFSFLAAAHITTRQGAFEVSVGEIGRPQAELEEEAIDILKLFIKEYIDVN